ncbi:MAG TPA: 30S ribosomal protein S6 [Saprospiraceae bacterium]|nr:30S ribosomal protein S6 [Saprospiraceae bacterium]
MRNYEVTFIVDPVLSGEETKATAQTYVELLESEDCKIVHVDEMGLRQLAYPINKRTSGVYYAIEFSVETGEVISKMELSLRRDERIMRFLTVKLDKYGVKYNEDKRNGLIGKKRQEEEEEEAQEESKGSSRESSKRRKPRKTLAGQGAEKPAAKKPAAKAEEEE